MPPHAENGNAKEAHAARPLGVGVIGLGRRWRRYRSALTALPHHFAVRLLCDQVQRRAEREARLVGCATAAGPSELLDNPQVEAVLLLDPQWFHLWPIERACQLGKPVFSCAAWESDDAQADAIARQVRDRGLPLMFEMAPRAAPATGRLHHLIDTQLGPARLLLCESIQAGPDSGSTAPGAGPESLLGPEGSALVDWCRALSSDEPERVVAFRAEGAGFAGACFACGDGRAIHISCRRVPRARPAQCLRVVAERGSAAIRLPGRISWLTADGRHVHRLRGHRPLAETLLLRFHQALQCGQSLGPTLDDAGRALRWLRAAAQSCTEGRPVILATAPAGAAECTPPAASAGGPP
jgi:predicted dehydrogenase